jgi:hypothetical protein
VLFNVYLLNNNQHRSTVIIVIPMYVTILLTSTIWVCQSTYLKAPAVALALLREVCAGLSAACWQWQCDAATATNLDCAG